MELQLNLSNVWNNSKQVFEPFSVLSNVSSLVTLSSIYTYPTARCLFEKKYLLLHIFLKYDNIITLFHIVLYILEKYPNSIANKQLRHGH